MFELPDSYYQPPDPPDEGNCPTCGGGCHSGELTPEGCAHCGGRVVLAEFCIRSKYRVYGYTVERVTKN